MPFNSQVRSVSLPHAQPATGGSSFFSSDESFHKSADHTQDLEESLEDAAQEPLDIVGALSTLNLDADLTETSPVAPGDASNDIRAEHKSSYAADNMGQTSSVPSQSILSHDILTPNAPSVATFGGIPNTLGNPASTPSYGWGNSFLPFSAPPMTYPDPSMQTGMPLQIPPFQLPEDHLNSNLSMGIGGQNNASKMATQPLHNFGGILDSRFAFDNFTSSSPDNIDALRYGSFNKSSGDVTGERVLKELYLHSNGNRSLDDSKEEVSSSKTSAHPQHYSGSNLWSQTQHQMPHFITQAHNDSYLANQFNQFSPVNMVSSSPSQNREHSSNAGLVGSSNGYVGSRGSNGDSGQQFGANRRTNHHMNGGVNVHRKMHNSNRRKGDDASKYTNAKLEDFTGEIFSLCKDQHGCRFLQRQLDLGGESKALSNDVAATVIFNELYLKIVELMIDPFGNYLIQKLFECVSADQRLVLVKNAAPDFIRIALDPHGTRALQKLVECVSTPEESRLVIENLSPHVVTLSRDLNGNHVVQKCLQKLKPEDNQFIFDTASMHCRQIATHRHGCCVLQRCLDHGNARQRRQLSLKVAEISTNLSLDPFGNYVVQYVLTRGDEKSISIILNNILSHIVSLSLHKFGSNVIEKSLRISHLTDAVIDVLLRNHKQFSLLLNDPYGNYVLQTSLDVASATDLAKLATSLQPFLPNIKNTPHGRRILTKIQNIL